MRRFLFFLVLVVLSSCEEESITPSVQTNSATAISCNQFYVTASVSQKGTEEIIDYGFIYYGKSFYDENPIPVIVSLGKNLSTQFSDTICFENNVFNNCFVKAYIKNVKGIFYGNVINFTSPQPSVFRITPVMASVGDTIIIKGKNLTSDINSVSVNFNYINSKIISVSFDEIKVIVPENIVTYFNSYIKVSVKVGYWTFYPQFMIAPKFFDFSPHNGTWGSKVYINAEIPQCPYGVNLNVKMDDIDCGYSSISSNSMAFHIPNNIMKESSNVYIYFGFEKYLLNEKFLMNRIDVSSVSKNKLIPGESLSILGDNFYPSNNSQSNLGWVKIGDYDAKINNANKSQLNITLPTSIPVGIYSVIVSNGITTDTIFNAIEIVLP